MTPARAFIAVGLLVAGCAGQAPTPPANEAARIPRHGDWFCQLDQSGDGWQCVQDPELAEHPQPRRLPQPRPATPEPPARPTVSPRNGPPAQTGSSELTPADVGDPATGADGETRRPIPAAPTDPPAPPPERPSPASESAEARVPAYVRLAYQPEQPVALSDLPGDFYTVQVLAMSSKEALEAFARNNRIRGASAARVERDGELYFVLLLGIYETRDAAREAAAELPSALAGEQPWIRTVSSLQAAMERADTLAGSTRF